MSPRRRAVKQQPTTTTQDAGPPTVLVTGDVVLDCHLYSRGKSAGTTSLGTDTAAYRAKAGGAQLTRELLEHAADARGLKYDTMRERWETENRSREQEGRPPNPLPADLASERPSPSYAVRFAFKNTAHLKPPENLRSYGVWTDRPARRDSTTRVWRVDRHFGYGSAKGRTTFELEPASPTGQPLLTVIDDGALTFRTTSEIWPRLDSRAGFYLLKMSGPICRGALWPSLGPVLNRLIVVVAADDLRREDVQISHRLSWERTVEETLAAMRDDPTVSQLRRAAHVIVVFGSEGALSIHHEGRGRWSAYLTFDPLSLEGQHAHEFDGTTYGFQTSFTSAVAHHLIANHLDAATTERRSPFVDTNAMLDALQAGIGAGLAAKRALLELGHGPVAPQAVPGFPLRELAPVVVERAASFVSVRADGPRTRLAPWTILAQSILPDDVLTPLTPLAHLLARDGLAWLADVPIMKIGGLIIVDRSEIESLRTIETLIRTYNDGKVQKKPLSIGVFGPPGAGKSFGVRAVAEGILGKNVPFLEFNLSQFKNPDDLIGPFHRVRDAVLSGTTPVAFWDEFDSQQYKWLQYLLAPMQDGAFQQDEVTHPIGKCIFIFAGGTSATLADFGIKDPQTLTARERRGLSAEEREALGERYDAFKLLKGPDFISRLHGFLNVLGPNPREIRQRQHLVPDPADITWPIRRALFLRHKLDLKGDQELTIDHGLLHALLSVPKYRHGARSFEKILTPLMYAPEKGRLHRAALPPTPSLDRDVEQAVFYARMREYDDSFKHLEQLAAAFHARFSAAAAQSTHTPSGRRRRRAWTVDPQVALPYERLGADLRKSNLIAARRIAEHLALIGFIVMPERRRDRRTWRPRLEQAIAHNVERLAQAEHRGWCVERRASGWSYAPVRNNERKQHPLLVAWTRLSRTDQDKDRALVRSIPDLLETGRLMAVPAEER